MEVTVATGAAASVDTGATAGTLAGTAEIDARHTGSVRRTLLIRVCNLFNLLFLNDLGQEYNNILTLSIQARPFPLRR